MKSGYVLFALTWLLVVMGWIVDDSGEALLYALMAFAGSLTSIILDAIEKRK